MTPDQVIVIAVHPAAKTDWSGNRVRVMDGYRIIGQTRWTFLEPFAGIEPRAWTDAALNVLKETNAK